MFQLIAHEIGINQGPLLHRDPNGIFDQGGQLKMIQGTSSILTQGTDSQ